MESKKISIIIPMLNEEAYITHCIDSILASDYPLDSMELIIINSMSKDKSQEIVESYIKKYPNIYCLDNPNIYTPFAFNLGIEKASGEYIFIVSSHCQYSVDYFSVLVKYAVELKADAVGAVSKTGILNLSSKAKAIQSVLSHRFGVGDSHFRIGSDEVKEVDAISGCYHRDVFSKYGKYNEKLIRNQDIELNKRIKNAGGKLYLIPHTDYTYFVRENFSALAKNNYSNGFWNILTSYYTKTFTSLSLRHFIPLIFILSLLLPSFCAFFSIECLWISVLSLSSYFALVIIISFKLKEDKKHFMYLLGSFLTLHFSYGVGSLLGIFSTMYLILKGKK